MQNPKFSLPDEFRSQLHYVDALDSRSDEEILDSLTIHVPVTSEKNIWTYWHAGVGSMPGWCQRNIVNWIRLCGPTWTVRVLDSVPGSPYNALSWVEAGQLPETFVKGTMDGPYGEFVTFLLNSSFFSHYQWFPEHLMLTSSFQSRPPQRRLPPWHLSLQPRRRLDGRRNHFDPIP